jgi:tetratricopeptide (TPR) repeat protein
MWIESVLIKAGYKGMQRLLLPLGLSLVLAAPGVAQDGQYRSKIRLDQGDSLSAGAGLSIAELEQQINSISDAYAKSSAGRHLARHYVEQKQYAKAIEFYQTALAAEGLSDVANREMLRELAQVYLLNEDYRAAARTLERALAIQLAPDAGDYLLLAQAYYRLGNYVPVVSALDKIAAQNLPLDIPQQRQALALYYQAGAYPQCERILRQLLDAEPGNADNWHQLASIYLQQGKRQQALDQLALAWEKSVPFREQEILLYADLQAVTGNPYGAAQTLAQALRAQTVEANGKHYRKLFEFWLTAREHDKATAALVQAARLTGDIELYLYLAQLQMEQEAWQPMYQTMTEACSAQLQDKYVSRANLLLGVSQLKLGDTAGARRSFINATLIGGATGQAGRWLQFMQAEPATAKEARRIVGICYGSSDKGVSAGSIAVAQAAADTDAPAEGQGEVAVQTRVVAPLRLFYTESDLPLPELAAKMRSLAVSMQVAIVKSGGAADGPLQLLSIGDGAGAQLQLGFPVKGSPRAGGRFKMRKSEPFNCAYYTYKGSMDGLVVSLGEFAEAVQAAGYELSDERRLVFANPKGDSAVEIEVQLGIQ